MLMKKVCAYIILVFLLISSNIPSFSQKENYRHTHSLSIENTTGIKTLFEKVVYPDQPDSIKSCFRAMGIYIDKAVHSYGYEFDQSGHTIRIFANNRNNDTAYIQKNHYQNDLLTKKEEIFPDSVEKNTVTDFFYNKKGFEIKRVETQVGMVVTMITKYRRDSIITLEKSTTVPKDFVWSARYAQNDASITKVIDRYHTPGYFDNSVYITLYDPSGTIVFESAKEIMHSRGPLTRRIKKTDEETFYVYSNDGLGYIKINHDLGKSDTTWYELNKSGDIISIRKQHWTNAYQGRHAQRYFHKKCGWHDTGKGKAFNNWRKGPCIWKSSRIVKKTGIDNLGNEFSNDVWKLRDGYPEIKTYKYEYDSHNNWIKKSFYKNGILHLIIEREITYYD